MCNKLFIFLIYNALKEVIYFFHKKEVTFAILCINGKVK